MFTLDDTARFVKVLALEVPWVHTFGKNDLQRREAYREAADEKLQMEVPANPLWWAFRITVKKTGRRTDIDNIPKAIIDAFCARQIERDKSSFSRLRLYKDDTLDHVRILQVVGNRSTTTNSTLIEVFACIGE